MQINAQQYAVVDFTWTDGTTTRTGTAILAASGGPNADTLADIFLDGLAANANIAYTVVATRVSEESARTRPPRTPLR